MDEDKNKVAVLPTGICKAKENVPGEPTTIYLPLDEMKSELLNEEEEFPDDQSSDEINLLNTEFRKEEETILEEQHTLFTPQVKQEIIEESPDVIKQEFYEEVLPYETKQETLKLELPHDQLTKQWSLYETIIFPNEDITEKPHYGKQVIGLNHSATDTTNLMHTPQLLARKKLSENESNSKWKCDVCNKLFSRTSMYRHKLIHENRKGYKCDVCYKAFNTCGSLSQHKLIHSDNKKHQCDVCDKAFSVSSTLKKHKLVVHSRIKKFQCDICEKTFGQISNLYVHKLIHSSVKNYKCDLCGKAFTQYPGLTKHKCTRKVPV